MAKRVAIVGGGLAGLSAAVRLLEKGNEVTLFEKRPYLGGRVSSFRDPHIGCDIDNGPHLLVGAYESTIRFLDLIGSASKVDFQSYLQTMFFDPINGWAELRSFPIFGKLHLAAGLFRFKFLSLKDKISIATAFLDLQKIEETPELDSVTVRDWLIKRKQTPASITYFWEILCMATINASTGVASFLQFLRVLKRSFLSDEKKSRLGFVNTSFSNTFGSPADFFLKKQGARIFKQQPILGIQMRGNLAVDLKLNDATYRDFDTLVLAIPPKSLKKLLPRGSLSQIFRKEIFFNPIVSVHLFLKEPIFKQKILAFLGGTSQWIFNMNAIRREISWGGYWFSVAISSAKAEIDLTKADLISKIISDFQKINPDLKSDSILHASVVKERYATALFSPGFDSIRPCQRTAFENVFLAGGWTKTGLPDTIESAVLSGELVAQSIG